jgi:predicted enzyme related to lactoylglutathione lyase
MNRNPVGWFEIYVQDMDRATAFYQKVLGCKLDKLPGVDLEMHAFPMNAEGYGASGALVRFEGAPSGGNSTLVYFSCEDCAAEEARVVPAGGKIMRGKFSIGQYGFCALAFDTEGNLFGLHSMK